MKNTRWISPYKENGRTNFPDRNKSGVYLIKREDEIVYIGYSGSDVYTTMYRHFQSWEDKSQIRVSYRSEINYYRDKFQVRILYMSKERAQKVEMALILKYRPKDNYEKYQTYSEEKENHISDKYAEQLTGMKPEEDLPF